MSLSLILRELKAAEKMTPAAPCLTARHTTPFSFVMVCSYSITRTQWCRMGAEMTFIDCYNLKHR